MVKLVTRMNAPSRFVNLFHLPSSSHLMKANQMATGIPTCRLGIPLVNGSIPANQFLISGVKS